MFLSKVTLQSSAQASLELAKLANNGVYSSHQLLWTLFKEAQKREFLYREEVGAAGKKRGQRISNNSNNSNNLYYMTQP